MATRKKTQSGQQKQPAPNSIGKKIAIAIGISVPVVGLIVAIFNYEHTRLKDIYETRLSQAKEQYENLNRDYDNQKKELGKVKDDLRIYAEREATAQKEGIKASPGIPSGKNQFSILKS